MQFYYLDHSSSLLLWKWIFLRKQQRMRMQWRRKRLLLADSSSVILWRMQWRRKRMRRNLLIFVLETCAARCTTKKGCSICIPSDCRQSPRLFAEDFSVLKRLKVSIFKTFQSLFGIIKVSKKAVLFYDDTRNRKSKKANADGMY